jgi:Protein of unknown function (DUF2934)
MAHDRLAPSAFEETQTLAHAIYQERGAESGHEFENWLEAETRLRALVNNPTELVSEKVHSFTEAETPTNPRRRAVGF